MLLVGITYQVVRFILLLLSNAVCAYVATRGLQISYIVRIYKIEKARIGQGGGENMLGGK